MLDQQLGNQVSESNRNSITQQLQNMCSLDSIVNQVTSQQEQINLVKQ